MGIVSGDTHNSFCGGMHGLWAHGYSPCDFVVLCGDVQLCTDFMKMCLNVVDVIEMCLTV